MSMDNQSEYSNNYFTKTERFWNYYRDEVNNDANEIDVNHGITNSKTSKSFEHEMKIIGQTPADNNTLDTVIFGDLLIYLWLTVK